MGKKSPFTIFTLLFLCLFAFGCDKQELERGLESKSASEIIVVLNRHGISAEKKQVSSGRAELYNISVSKGDYAKAIEILHQYDLPRSEKSSVDKLIRSQGFVPIEPELAALRLDYALSLEVERLLASLPAVVKVTAIVRSHLRTNRRVSLLAEQPTAEVIIYYTSKSDTEPFDVNSLKEQISRIVPGLKSEKVFLSTKRVYMPGDSILLGESSGKSVQLTKLFPIALGFNVPQSEQLSARKEILILCMVMLGIGILFGTFMCFWFLRRSQKKHRVISGQNNAPIKIG